MTTYNVGIQRVILSKISSDKYRNITGEEGKLARAVFVDSLADDNSSGLRGAAEQRVKESVNESESEKVNMHRRKRTNGCADGGFAEISSRNRQRRRRLYCGINRTQRRNC